MQEYRITKHYDPLKVRLCDILKTMGERNKEINNKMNNVLINCQQPSHSFLL